MVFSSSQVRTTVVSTCLAGALFVAPALAATTTTNLNVSASVVDTCVVSASNVNFGTYGGTQLDGAGTVSVTCTNLAAYTVELDAGGGAGASVASRKLTGPASQTINYSLYKDAARTTLWGTVAGSQSVAGTGTGTQQVLNVYGRMPASQTPGAGTYNDTVIVTVAY
jgi:spore coat protein U-like protein